MIAVSEKIKFGFGYNITSGLGNKFPLHKGGLPYSAGDKTTLLLSNTYHRDWKGKLKLTTSIV